MDLSTLAAAAVLIDVPVVFDEDGKAVSGFKVLGANSKEYQETDRKWRVQNVKKAAIRGKGVDSKTDDGASEVIGALEKRDREIVNACIAELYGFTDGGEALALAPQNLDRIFVARPTWRSKVLAAIESEGNFTRG